MFRSVAFSGANGLTLLLYAAFSGALFLLPFELAAVILTVAVIAAVMLTLRRRTGNKHQNPSEQSAVRAQDRIRMVKMEAVKPQPIAQDNPEAP